jgi:hypothetical protein
MFLMFQRSGRDLMDSSSKWWIAMNSAMPPVAVIANLLRGFAAALA